MRLFFEKANRLAINFSKLTLRTAASIRTYSSSSTLVASNLQDRPHTRKPARKRIEISGSTMNTSSNNRTDNNDRVSRQTGHTFTLLNYNILSQVALHSHPYLYENCDPSDTEWPSRGHRILHQINESRADIICLQELEHEHLMDLFGPAMAELGYESVFKKRTGSKGDGCAVFFYRESFDLISSREVEFNRNDPGGLLDRDNVGLIVILTPRSRDNHLQQHLQASSSYDTIDGSRHVDVNLPKLAVATTHLLYNPKRTDIRLAQLRLFLNELEQTTCYYDEHNQFRRLPTILCGDLNSVPESGTIKYIKNGYVPRRYCEPSPKSPASDSEPQDDESADDDTSPTQEPPAHSISALLPRRHHFKFSPVYPLRNHVGTPYVSTFSNLLVDYIYFTASSRLTLKSYRGLLTPQELNEFGPLPNKWIPSDHLPLEATFHLC